MPRSSLLVRAGALAVVIGVSGASAAAEKPPNTVRQQAAPESPESPGSPKTLKERLGDKASDEQRVDNCKVPADRRGSKARPDSCTH
jgi:hypothetical protein